MDQPINNVASTPPLQLRIPVTMEMVRNLRTIAGKLREGGTTLCNSADRIILMVVVNKLKELYPLVIGVPDVTTIDMTDPLFFPESLELVATLLSKRSLARLNVEKYIEFLPFLVDKFLDI